MKKHFEVYEVLDGVDTNGPYYRDHESAMTEDDIHTSLGRLLTRYDTVIKSSANGWDNWHFEQKTEVGYRRCTFAVKNFET